MTDLPQNLPAPYGFGLTKISGWAGFGVWLGQLLAGRPSKYEHAFLLLPSASQGTIVLEAEPGGARVTTLDEYWNGTGWDAEFVYPPMSDIQKADFEAVAGSLVGTPYSWLDYLALVLYHLHIHPNWVEDRVTTSNHQICSQMVDFVYKHAGVQLFDDGRFPGNVMPSDLAHLAKEKGWIK